MDFSYYNNFITIVESGTMTAAARKLNLAQPALSAQLKIMEQSYGAKLLKAQRGVRQTELTHAGQIFYEKAKALRSIEESTRIEIQNCSKGLTGTLKISLSPARAPLFIKQFIKPFSKLYPNIQYQIHEVDVNAQVLHIINGIADIAIANASLPEPHRFKILLAQKDHFVVVTHKNSPVLQQGKKSPQLKTLQGQALYTNFGSFPILSKVFEKAKITPNFAAISTTRMTALQFVQENMGIAVIPAEKGEKFGPELVAVPLMAGSLFVTKTVFIAKGKKPPVTVQNFLDFYIGKYNKT